MTKFLLTTLLILSFNLHAHGAAWPPSSEQIQIPIWPNSIPDAQPMEGPEYFKSTTDYFIAGKPLIEVGNVSKPTITLYSPKEKNTGVAVVVFPGGGYKALAIDLEGTEVCDWLTTIGVTCILLKYRVPDSGPHWDPKKKKELDAKAPTALEDAQRAVGLVRFRAKEWHINPDKIGVLGFSAGGHLVADIGTHFDKRLYPMVDDVDKVSCRPDFGVALYPGHMLEHTSGNFDLNPKVPITAKTPPMFILQAEDDPVDEVKNSLVFYIALERAGVPVEMHLYAHGKHAFGLRPTDFPITKWPHLVETWLKTIAMF